jgi:hypothetical protein
LKRESRPDALVAGTTEATIKTDSTQPQLQSASDSTPIPPLNAFTVFVISLGKGGLCLYVTLLSLSLESAMFWALSRVEEKRLIRKRGSERCSIKVLIGRVAKSRLLRITDRPETEVS